MQRIKDFSHLLAKEIQLSKSKKNLAIILKD